jgi:hypothetical protein
MTPPPAPRRIGTLNEKPLHAALKQWYARPGDELEVNLDGFVVDIVRGDLLIEIQTRGFGKIARKLARLAETHPVRLVHPIAQEKFIVRLAGKGERQLSRRKSPRRGAYEHIFMELVSLPTLLLHPNFSLEVLLIREEEFRRRDARRWRRGGWVTQRHCLLDVVGQKRFESPDDLAALIPADLAEPFTTADIAAALHQPRWLAQKMAYCLNAMGVIQQTGKHRNAKLYARQKRAPQPAADTER